VERKEIVGEQKLTNKKQTAEIPEESTTVITEQSSEKDEKEQTKDTAITTEAGVGEENTGIETPDIKQFTTREIEMAECVTKTSGTTSGNISTRKGRKIVITREDNKQQKSNNRRRIVEQKGVGQFSKYRVQWQDNNGKTASEWQTIHNVDRELLDKWRISHGSSGQTLKNYRRAGKGRPKRF